MSGIILPHTFTISEENHTRAEIVTGGSSINRKTKEIAIGKKIFRPRLIMDVLTFLFPLKVYIFLKSQKIFCFSFNNNYSLFAQNIVDRLTFPSTECFGICAFSVSWCVIKFSKRKYYFSSLRMYKKYVIHILLRKTLYILKLNIILCIFWHQYNLLISSIL